MSTVSKKKKESIIYGALAGTLGIFLTKAVGLLYASPFHALAGDQMIFYTYTYQIYQYLLDLSTSGIPFAIATLVSRYASAGDYEMTTRVRRVSSMMMKIIGVTVCALVILGSGPLAHAIVPGRDPLYYAKLQNCLIIMSGACVAVPILSAYRGYYQGLREIEVYSFTQVLEQLIRVIFLLGVGAIAVYVFHKDAIWAVYSGVAAMTVSAIGTILYFRKTDSRVKKEIEELSAEAAEREDVQRTRKRNASKTTKDILKELLTISIPFLVQAVINNSFTMVNLFYVPRNLIAYGYGEEMADTIYSIMNFDVAKITSIPSILGPGFAVAIVPHLSAALQRNDREKMKDNIRKCFSTANFFAFPVIIFMIIYSRQIYQVMFGLSPEPMMDLQTKILQLGLLEIFFWLEMFISNHLMLALNLRWWSTVLSLVKLGLTVIGLGWMVRNYSFTGCYVYTMAIDIFTIVADWIFLYVYHRLSPKDLFRTTLKEIAAMVPALLLVWVFCRFMPVIGYGRIGTFVIVILQCIPAGILYLAAGWFLKVPQQAFGVDAESIKKRFLKR